MRSKINKPYYDITIRQILKWISVLLNCINTINGLVMKKYKVYQIKPKNYIKRILFIVMVWLRTAGLLLLWMRVKLIWTSTSLCPIINPWITLTIRLLSKNLFLDISKLIITYLTCNRNYWLYRWLRSKK